MKTANTLKLSPNVIANRLETAAQTLVTSSWNVVTGSSAFLAAFLVAILLAACGDDSVSDNAVQMMPSNMDVVAELDDLPACKKSNEGEQIWVKGESAARICVDGKWYALSNGSAECVTESLSDKSGVKIVCNGDSVGVVLNGENGGVGVSGKDGTNGKDGVNGTNGKDGTDGKDGADGVDGRDGLNGKDGINGVDGKDGADGKDGKNGTDGKDGTNGKDGADGINGTDGKDGRDGADGKDGINGKDGVSCTAITLADNSGLKILCGGDSVGVVYNGRDGKDGADGKNGENGKDGANGRDGVDGKDGTNGSNGNNGSDGTNGNGCSILSKDCILHVACGNDTVSLDLYSSEEACHEIAEIDPEKIAVSLDEVSGVTQKGPFLMGSKVLVREMEDGRTLTQTGNSFNGKILNDRGEFKIKARMLVSQYVMLEASGYYRNEITGENSISELTLFAITDVNERNTVNVNLLTHLEYERVIYLVTQKKMKVRDAKKQAQKEVFALLNIDATDFSNSEDLNIAGASDEDGALLAFSIIFQGDRSVPQLSELLQKIAIDMEEDGTWDDAAVRVSLADWASQKELDGKMVGIRQNVANWQLSSVVPNFEKHIHKFWRTEYGLGNCADENEGEVLQNTNGRSNTNGKYFICKSGRWTTASSIEFDTYQWKSGTDGDVRSGDVVPSNCYVFENNAWRSGNASDCSLGLRGCTMLRQDTVGKGSDNVWHICDAQSWRNATTYEKDTFGWKNSTDGAIKKGNVTDTVYVFDKTVWRATSNVESKLGGCVSAIADSIGTVDGTYYICKSNVWVEASAIEYDTYHWTAGKDGDSKWGDVNTDYCYVYENNAWRSGNTSDCSLELRGCTALRQDTVGKGSDDVWYKCVSQAWRTATEIEKDTATWGAGEFDGEVRTGQVNETIYYIYETSSNAWRNATALEYDTYQVVCSEDGKMFNGNVNTTTKYVCDNGVFRAANEIETEADTACTSYNRNKDYILPKYDGKNNYSYYKCGEGGWSFTIDQLNKGTMVDARDGHEYKTIGIKSQMWMAENLIYVDNDVVSWCFNNEESNCANGRLYARVGEGCPNGWHIPDSTDWITLHSEMDPVYDFYANYPGAYIYGEGRDEFGEPGWEEYQKYLEGSFEERPFGYADLYASSTWYGDFERFMQGDAYGYGDMWTGNFFTYDCSYLNLTCAVPVRCIKDEEE